MAFHMSVANLMKQIGVAKTKISDKNIKRVLKEEVIRAYNVVAENTPQYSGYLVSNLRVQVDGIGSGVAPDLRKEHDEWRKADKTYGAKKKGDNQAIDIASAYNGWFNQFDTDPAWSMKQTVTITYLTDYWRTAESGVGLRDVNKPGKALAMGKAAIRYSRRGMWYNASFDEQI